MPAVCTLAIDPEGPPGFEMHTSIMGTSARHALRSRCVAPTIPYDNDELQPFCLPAIIIIAAADGGYHSFLEPASCCNTEQRTRYELFLLTAL
jgi:hypothetical protein